MKTICHQCKKEITVIVPENMPVLAICTDCAKAIYPERQKPGPVVYSIGVDIGTGRDETVYSP